MSGLLALQSSRSSHNKPRFSIQIFLILYIQYEHHTYIPEVLGLWNFIVKQQIKKTAGLQITNIQNNVTNCE